MVPGQVEMIPVVDFLVVGIPISLLEGLVGLAENVPEQEDSKVEEPGEAAEVA